MKHLGIKVVAALLIFPVLSSCNFTGESSFDDGNNRPDHSGTIDNEPREEAIRGVYYGFDTYYNLTLYNAPISAKKSMETIINDYSALTDNYHEIKGKNTIYTINNSSTPVKIDERLFDILEKSLQYQEALNGYFNPLLGKLSKLWKSSINADKPFVPSQKDIDRLLTEAKNSKLILDKENMTAQVIGGAEIDLGAIAKGYSMDKMVEVCEQRRITEYIIDGGSSSIALGKKPGKGDFNVGLKDIDKAYFSTHDEIISTSSMFEQGTTIDGVKYSHILNPFTGSAKTELDLVMVKGPIDGGLLDCMSTAFSCMSIDEIKKVEANFDVDILVYDEGQIIYQSKNMEVKYH